MFAALVGYIDAGTGSYLLTAIAGGFAALWFFLRTKIDSIVGRFRRKDAQPQAAPSAAETEGRVAADAATDAPPLRQE